MTMLSRYRAQAVDALGAFAKNVPTADVLTREVLLILAEVAANTGLVEVDSRTECTGPVIPVLNSLPDDALVRYRSAPIAIYIDPAATLEILGWSDLYCESRLALLGLHPGYPDAHISGVELAEALDELEDLRFQDEESWFTGLRDTAMRVAEELQMKVRVEVLRGRKGPRPDDWIADLMLHRMLNETLLPGSDKAANDYCSREAIIQTERAEGRLPHQRLHDGALKTGI